MKKIFKNQAGQGLLEALVATTIIVVGISGVIGLSGNNLIASNVSTSELVAVNLSREAIEVLTNIRDNNYLNSAANWDEGLKAGTSDFDGILVYDVTTHTWSIDFLTGANDFTDTETIVYFDPGSNLYLQNSSVGGSWQATSYRRLVHVYNICENNVDDFTTGLCGASPVVGYRIVVDIQWNDHGNIRNSSLEKRIFNWR